MKVAFCTCVTLGLSCIEKVHSLNEKFDLFITLEDHLAKKKSGRIYLDKVAEESNTPLLKTSHINNDEIIKAIRQHDIDWLFIIGWSQIASEDVIQSCKKGAIGAHPTLLPVGRGRAAIPWAIIKGLDSTGLTFFNMDKGVDTGDILEQIEIPITANETSSTLYKKVNTAHIDLIEKIWPKITANSLLGEKQDESQATYWEGRKPKDGEIKPKDMNIEEVDRLVRATTKPYPGAFILKDNKKVIIWAGVKDKDIKGMGIVCRNGIFTATDIEILEI